MNPQQQQYSSNGRQWRPVTGEEVKRLVEDPRAEGWLRFPAMSEKTFNLSTARMAWRLGEPGKPLAVVLHELLPSGD